MRNYRLLGGERADLCRQSVAMANCRAIESNEKNVGIMMLSLRCAYDHGLAVGHERRLEMCRVGGLGRVESRGNRRKRD